MAHIKEPLEIQRFSFKVWGVQEVFPLDMLDISWMKFEHNVGLSKMSILQGAQRKNVFQVVVSES